jgi:hypothetical protein
LNTLFAKNLAGLLLNDYLEISVIKVQKLRNNQFIIIS